MKKKIHDRSKHSNVLDLHIIFIHLLRIFYCLKLIFKAVKIFYNVFYPRSCRFKNIRLKFNKIKMLSNF